MIQITHGTADSVKIIYSQLKNVGMENNESLITSNMTLQDIFFYLLY